MDEQQGATHQHARGGCFFCDIAAPQIEAFMDHVWPKDTREHFRNARVEMLKGVRSMLDARIDRLSKHDAKGTKVTVE
jgi:hypothetical protein